MARTLCVISLLAVIIILLLTWYQKVKNETVGSEYMLIELLIRLYNVRWDHMSCPGWIIDVFIFIF